MRKDWGPIFATKREDADRVQRAIAERDKAAADIFSWVKRYRYIDGQPWSYDSGGPRVEYGKYDKRREVMPRPYLEQYVGDIAPVRSVIKPRQSELTENQINENLFYAVTRAARVAHIFPTDEMGDAISNEKIRPAIYESPEILPELNPPGAVRRYSFKTGGNYTITGALKRAGGRAASKDILIFDEWDFIPEAIAGVYQELLSHSKLRLERYISTPTVPGVGIDLAYRNGCGYQWHVKCPKCKRVQTFEFPDSLINYFEPYELDQDSPEYQKRLKEIYIGCKHCGAYIDRGSQFYQRTSRWVAERPALAKENASYAIQVPMIPWKTGVEIARKAHALASYQWQFYNEVWGRAYLKEDNRLTDDEILACCDEYQMVNVRLPVLRNISVGVDWGENQSWVVVSASGMLVSEPNKRCTVYLEEINPDTLRNAGFAGKPQDHVERVIQIAGLFNADIIVNDANGIGIDRNAKLIDKFPGRAWGAFFDTAEMGRQLRQSKLQIPQWTSNSRRVTLSKVATVKHIQVEIRNRQVALPVMSGSAGDVIRKFARHNRNLAIQPRWSTEYEREFEVAVKLGDDHFFDANMYSKIGWDRLTGASGTPTATILKPHY